MKWICLLTFLFCASVIGQKAFGQSSRSYVAGNFTLMMDTKSGGWICKEGNTLVFKVVNSRDTAELRRRNQKIINEAKLPYFIRFEIDPGFKPGGITKGLTDFNNDTLPKAEAVTTVKHNPSITLPPVAFSVLRTARINFQPGEEVKLIYFTEVYDEGNVFNTHRFTAPYAGIYHFDTQTQVRINSNNSHLQFFLKQKDPDGKIIAERSAYENRDQHYEGRDDLGNKGVDFTEYSLYSMQISCDLKMAKGEYVELFVKTNLGAGGFVEKNLVQRT